MSEFLTFISMAILVEAVISWVDAFATKEASKVKLFASIIFGVGLSVIYNLDLLKVLGYEAPVQYVGSAVTGLIIARGSNYFFDLIGRLTNENTELANDSTIVVEPTIINQQSDYLQTLNKTKDIQDEIMKELEGIQRDKFCK